MKEILYMKEDGATALDLVLLYYALILQIYGPQQERMVTQLLL